MTKKLNTNKKLIANTAECGYKVIASVLKCTHPKATFSYCDHNDFPNTCPLETGMDNFEAIAMCVKATTPSMLYSSTEDELLT